MNQQQMTEPTHNIAESMTPEQAKPPAISTATASSHDCQATGSQHKLTNALMTPLLVSVYFVYCDINLAINLFVNHHIHHSIYIS